MREHGEGCWAGPSLVTPLEALLLKVRELHTEQILMAMTEDTGNTGTEKLALVAEKLVTTGKNGQRCWKMSGKARKGAEP